MVADDDADGGKIQPANKVGVRPIQKRVILIL